MERTLEIMKEELRIANEERQPLYEAIEIANEKIQGLNEEIETYRLNNGLYHSMSELANYKGKEIAAITLVRKNEDGTLSSEYRYNDESFIVDENGCLDYSSFNCGVMRYDENVQKYVEWGTRNRVEHDYIGFLEIELKNEKDNIV